MTTEAMQRHIEHLADNYGCKIIQEPNKPGMMYVEFGYVEGPIIENQRDYMVMLHELGHFALGHTQGRPPSIEKAHYFDNGVLRSEAEAWEWALDRQHDFQGEDALEPETRRFMWNTCLGSYWAGAYYPNGTRWNYREDNRLTNGDRHYVRFKYDDADKYFYSIKERMLDL